MTLSQRLRSPICAAVVVRVVGVYILVGGLAKLFWGAPPDLPAALLQALPAHEAIVFAVVIAVELLVGLTALLSPRLGWLPAAGLLTIFLCVLALQADGGSESCGCFGSTVAVPVWVMVLIDVMLLMALLAAAPWQRLDERPWRWWSLAAAAIVVVAAMTYLSIALHPVDVPNEGTRTSSTPSPAAVEPASTWRLPTVFPRYVRLKPPTWIGRRLSKTALAPWADTARFPADATIVFYYETCDHCATHLRHLAQSPGDASYVLIQLPTDPRNTLPPIVDALPEGLRVKLPLGPKWYIQTPWEVVTKDGIVVDAVKHF